MDFLVEWRKSKENVLVILILDKIANRLFKNYDLNSGRILATVLLFILFEIVQIVIMVLARRPVSMLFTASLTVSAITALCFFSIASSHQYALELWENILQQKSLGNKPQTLLISWLKKSANLPYQIFASTILTIVILWYAFFFDILMNPWDVIIYFPLVAMGGAQGLYWGVTTPLMTAILRRTPIFDFAHDPIYPSRSSILTTLSKMLLRFAAWIGVLATLVIIFAILAKPLFSQNGIAYFLVPVGIGYIASGWTFLNSQFNLSHLVRKIKENTLSQIQHEANKLYLELERLEKSDFERFNSLMDLHSTMQKRPNSIIDTSTMSSLLSSLLPPIVVTALGIVDWNNLFQMLYSWFR